MNKSLGGPSIPFLNKSDHDHPPILCINWIIVDLQYCDSFTCMLLLLSCVSRVQLCDPIDGSPPGSPVPGILQARTLEWVAISFSNAWKWKSEVDLSCPTLSDPMDCSYQASPSMRFSRQEYWSGVPLPSPFTCIAKWFIYECVYIHIYTHICIYILFQILFHYGLLQDTEYISL